MASDHKYILRRSDTAYAGPPTFVMGCRVLTGRVRAICYATWTDQRKLARVFSHDERATLLAPGNTDWVRLEEAPRVEAPFISGADPGDER